MIELLPAVLAVALVLALVGLVIALRFRNDGALSARLDELIRDNERLERELRAAVDGASGQLRLETGARLTELQSGLMQQMTGQAGLQGQQLLGFGQQVAKLAEAAEASARANREEGTQQLKNSRPRCSISQT
jgi:DNA recombination protein RmuC